MKDGKKPASAKSSTDNDMNEELQTNLANEIQRIHIEAQDTAARVKESMGIALDLAAQCGRLLSIAKEQTKGQFIAWLRDNVPGITQDHVRTYLDCFHMAEEQRLILDSRKAHQLGFFDKGEMHGTPQPRAELGAGKWIGWAANISGWFTKTTREKPLKEWQSHEKEAVMNQLRPLVDIYHALKDD